MATIVDAFHRQVASRPDSLAVIAASDRLTYAQLQQRSDRLAAALREGGILHGDHIVIMMERSADLPVAMLAVLKAGGTYVPLSSSEPVARLGAMAADTGATVAICDDANRRLVKQLGLTPYDPARDVAARRRYSGPVGGGRDLAYLMYTSGSTGRPKAVMVEHDNVVNLVTRPNYVDLTARDRVLQLAPICFDAATFEIWGPLLNGGCVVMAPQHVLPDQLGDLLQTYSITKLWLTAALLHTQVDVDIDALRGIDTLLAGGDVLSVPHVKKLLSTVPDCAVVNGYGPTETTTFACCHRVRRDEDFSGSIPIGRPIQNVRVRVVDEHGADVAPGTPGELLIGGAGVGRGYWRREALTAEKFTADETGVLYRSGDLARQRPDGPLEFLGRLDGQMKLHGRRIEPGEVEHALVLHPQVRQAAVALRTNHLGDAKLVAWIVPTPATNLDRRDLRVHLKQLVPHFMVPAAFVAIERLPVTPNDKVDLGSLVVPDWRERAIYA